MNPTPQTNGLYSILKIAILTAVGAFFGALSMTGIPSTWADAKSVLMPALGAAIAAEVYYLRTTFQQLLTQAGGQLPPAPAPSTASSGATKPGQAGYSMLHALVAMVFLGVVVLLALAGQHLLALVGVALLGVLLLLPPRATRWPSIAFACLSLVGCAGLFNSIGPAEDCGNRIAADCAKGESLLQVIEDVAAPCGLDVVAIISQIAASKDPTVQKSKAYGEAVKLKAQLDAANPGS